AFVAYRIFLGLLCAYFIHKYNRHDFSPWHIKIMFGLLILLFFSVVPQAYSIGVYVYWTSVVLWIISLIMALLNQKRGIPFLSEKFQTWFTFLD
ncbi:MAG: hypothetical protein DRI70_08880, partial [Bacteroidetes bacterium]